MDVFYMVKNFFVYSGVSKHAAVYTEATETMMPVMLKTSLYFAAKINKNIHMGGGKCIK